MFEVPLAFFHSIPNRSGAVRDRRGPLLDNHHGYSWAHKFLNLFPKSMCLTVLLIIGIDFQHLQFCPLLRTPVSFSASMRRISFGGGVGPRSWE